MIKFYQTKNIFPIDQRKKKFYKTFSKFKSMANETSDSDDGTDDE